jgi:hypothetical protein
MSILNGRRWLLAFLSFAGLSPASLLAQLDLLSVREAESLVEEVPEFQAAKRQGRCPDFSVGYVDSVTLLIQVRGDCPDADTASTLISDYMVDRRTGIVSKGEASTPITSPAMERQRKELLQGVRTRSVSRNEAACLVLAAFKSKAHIHETTESFSVTQIGASEGHELQYSAQQHLLGRHAVTSGFFTVDTATGRVRDDGTGADVASAEIGSLVSNLFALRFPPLLSTDDAVEVALHVQIISLRLSGSCSTAIASGTGTAEEVFIGITSQCRGMPETSGVLASVNIRTGVVTDPKTLKDISSAESQRIARRLLDEVERHQAKARSDIGAECRSN